MQFLTKAKLKFEYKDDNKIKWYSLKNDLILYVGEMTLDLNRSTKVPRKELIIIPKEIFIFDVASIPRLLHWVYRPTGKYSRSAIVHDYFYSKRDIKRSYADKMFLKCMKVDKVNFFTRWLFYISVRIGGKSHKA